MTSIQILKLNQELEKKAEQLIDLSVNLLSENRRRSNEIEKLILEQIETNNKALEICLLLYREIPQNYIFQTDPENVHDTLDNIRILIKKLLHNLESSEREKEILKKDNLRLKRKL